MNRYTTQIAIAIALLFIMNGQGNGQSKVETLRPKSNLQGNDKSSPSTVKIVSGNYHSSGFIVSMENRLFVLTCNHCIAKKCGESSCRIIDTYIRTGDLIHKLTPIARITSCDAICFEVNHNDQLRGVSLKLAEEVSDNEEVAFWGHGSKVWVKGRLNLKSGFVDFDTLNAPCVAGDSGSPLLNSNGDVVGMIVGNQKPLGLPSLLTRLKDLKRLLKASQDN